MNFRERVANLVSGGALRRLETKAAEQTAAMGQMVFGRPQLTLLMPRTRYDFQSQVGNGLGSAVIMAPVLWIARTFPEAPVIVKEEDEIVVGHPMTQLLHRPNPYYSGSILWMATMISWTMDGNAYWVKIRNAAGSVIQLWYVPHWMMKPMQEHATDYISKYLYLPGGRRLEIETTEVVHFRFGIDPENTMKGFSQLKPLYREVFTDDEAANWSAHLLRNSGVPGVIVAPSANGQTINEEDAKTMKEDFRNLFTGDRRGDPFVATAPVDVHKFAWSPSEMDMAKLREIPEERVCAVIGIPAAVVGFGSGLAQTKVGATMEQMLKQAYQSCLIPTQRLIAEELDVQLLPDFDNNTKRRASFDYRKVRALQEDTDALFTRWGNAYKASFVMKSEARKAVGLPVEPADDVYLVPFSSVEVPAGASAADVTAAASAKAPANGKARPHPLPVSLLDAKRLLTVIRTGRLFPETKISKRQAALIRQMNSDAVHLAAAFSGELVKRFDKLGTEAAAQYAAHELVAAGLHKGSGNGHSTKVADPALNTPDDHIIVSQVMDALDVKPLDYKPHYLRVAHATIDAINAHMNLGLDLTDNMEQDIVAAGGKHMGLVDMAEQAKDSMFQALTEGREIGEGADAMARRIRDKVAAGPWSTSEVRARVIARTETKYAQNISSVEACKGGAGIVGMTVIDAQLGPTDAECEDINGAEVSFEEAEQLSESEHPNGTRQMLPRMAET